MPYILKMGSPKQLVVLMLLLTSSAILSSCTKQVSEPVVDETKLRIAVPLSASSVQGGTSITTASFTAIAAVGYCWGENIRFSGTIENKVNSVTDANGVTHYTRHWIIKGLDATGLGNTQTGLAAGTTYTVVAGAEMFTITDPVFNSSGVPVAASSGKIFIHQGTVVFESSTGERLVARHVIRKNPGTGQLVSAWYCMGN